MPHMPVIDGFEFAESASTLKGASPIKEFARLHDILFDDSGAVEYELRGARDARGRAGLRLAISGSLQLVCQRCLGRMNFPLSIDRFLLLARSQQEIETEVLGDGEPDRVLAGRAMPVADLVEDELLLELPIAARHERCATGIDAPEAQGGHAGKLASLQEMLEGGKTRRNH